MTRDEWRILMQQKQADALANKDKYTPQEKSDYLSGLMEGLGYESGT